jgi:cytochrome c553
MAILALVFSSVASMADQVETASIAESFAKTDCNWCHLPARQGYQAAPQLSGQRRQYIENQLRAYHTHSQDGPFAEKYMWGAAARLNPDSAHGLAAYFSTLSAEPAEDGDKQLAAAGEQIYREGTPATSVPSCAVCHGLNAEGIGEIPRLGGLSYHYLKRKLEEWGKGYNAAAGGQMPGIANNLSPSQIDALASYLSFVR